MSSSQADLADPRFAPLTDALDALQPRYVRARALRDATGLDARTMVSRLARQLSATVEEAQLGTFLNTVAARRARLKTVTLNVAALAALHAAKWEPARRLAWEVVHRDHFDLISQRIIDAADEHSTMMESAVDRWLRGRHCSAPDRQIETRVNGDVHLCCAAWQPVPIGTLADTDAGWRSAAAAEIRRSVREGDFSHCSRWHCPAIAERRLALREPDEPGTPEGPLRVILSHDRSCNISCPSCRTEVILLPHADTDRLDRDFETRLLPLIATAEEIKVTGSGDPFGSRHFRHVLRRLTQGATPRRRLQLHTNGLLADARAWQELGLAGHVGSVWVSVDAAEPDTYAELRRGGSFAQLLPNLEFLGDLRRRGEIDSLRLDFVVQDRNFEEMSAFTDLAKACGASGVYFLRLRNWGHIPPETFRRQDVCAPDHPRHAALLAALRDPRLAAPEVSLGSMAQLAETARRNRC